MVSIQLDEQQQRIVDYTCKAPSDEVVIISGPAGSGKSVIVRELTKRMPNHAVAAPTGCAAVLIGGTTIHKLFSLNGRVYEGITRQEYQRRLFAEHWNDKKRVFGIMGMEYNKKAMEFLSTVGCIILDEFSQIRCDIFDEINIRLQHAKKNPGVPFGGTKIVMMGDLGQLGSVVTARDEKKLLALGYKAPFDYTVSKVFMED